MRTATGLTLDAIERAQDNLLVAHETGQVDSETYERVFDKLLQCKLELMGI